MKAIKISKKRLSPWLRLAFIVALLMVTLALILSIKFAGKTKDLYPQLVFSESIATPTSSSNSGFYKSELLLELSSEQGVNIYYSTDGSAPSLASEKYQGPFTIHDRRGERNELSVIPTSPRWKPPFGDVFKGTVVRAIAVDNKNQKSKELVRTYFIDEEKKYTLPVVSIVVDQKDLFGYNKGIYVLGKSYTDKDNYIRKNIPLDLPWWEYPSNYLLRGNDSEREAYIELFEPDGKVRLAFGAGIRINGNATRGFAQKSLRIICRKKYSTDHLNYPLFGKKGRTIFHSFLLRNSGNDWDKTMFRDVFMQSLMEASHLDIQMARPSVVFINGEYWGIHNIQERFDEHYLSDKYNMPLEGLAILELNGTPVYGKKTNEEDFISLLEFVKNNDLSKTSNYDFVTKKMDVRSFIDFVIANVYYCNSDWPNNNVKFWRCNPENTVDTLSPCDGRWRWMLFDTDWGFGYNALSSPESNLLEKATRVGSVGVLFRGLAGNADFKNEFLQRFQFHLDHTFNPERVIAKIDSIEKILEPEMKEHIDRWRAIGSYSAWQENVGLMRDFANARPAFQVAQLNAFFKLEGESQIRLKK